MEYPLNQSSWDRAKQDTLSAFHTARFWLFELCTVAGLTVLVLQWTPSVISKDWKIVYQVLTPLGGVFAGLAVVFLISLFIAPYRQRNEGIKKLLNLQDTREYEKSIMSFFVGGANLPKKLKHPSRLAFSRCEQKEIEDFDDWYTAISEYLQRHMPREYPSWYRSVFIGINEPDVTEVLKALELGLDILEGISKNPSSSISHTEG